MGQCSHCSHRADSLHLREAVTGSCWAYTSKQNTATLSATLPPQAGRQQEGTRTVERGQLLQLQALVLVACLVRGHQQVLYHLRCRIHLRAPAVPEQASDHKGYLPLTTSLQNHPQQELKNWCSSPCST